MNRTLAITCYIDGIRPRLVSFRRLNRCFPGSLATVAGKEQSKLAFEVNRSFFYLLPMKSSALIPASNDSDRLLIGVERTLAALEEMELT
jgi:hypothetical protein